MFRGCFRGHRQAAKSPAVTASDRLCLEACKEVTFLLQKCAKGTKVKSVQQLSQLVAFYQPQLSVLQGAGSAAELSFGDLRAALALIAQASKVIKKFQAENSDISKRFEADTADVAQLTPEEMAQTSERSQQQHARARQQLVAIEQNYLQLTDELKEMQAESIGLKAQLSREQDSNSGLLERITTLEAELADKAKQAVGNEDEVDCLQIELADADANSEKSLQILADAQQEPVKLQQVVVYMNPTYELRDIYVADEKEKQDAEQKVASLQQQLEQAGMAHKLALATLQQELQQAQARSSTLIQDCNMQLAAEKEAHRVTTQARLAAGQHATALLTDLETVQQELTVQTQSCTTAAEKAASCQAELETVRGDVSALQQQLKDALQEVKAEQQRHKGVKQTAEGLQSQLQDVQQELSATQQACKDAEVQKATAQQSASSSHCQLQTAQQLLRDRKEAHVVALADLHSDSKAAHRSLEARSKVAEDNVVSLKTQSHEAVRGSRSLQKEVDARNNELQGRSEAADQKHHLKVALRHAPVSVETQVDPALVAEVPKSKATSDWSDNGHVSSGTDTLPCLADLQQLKETMAAVQTDRDAAIKKLQDNKAGYLKILSSVFPEVLTTSSQYDSLAAELAARNSALSACQAKSVHLLQELLSYRSQCEEMNSFATFTQQHKLAASRMGSRCRQVSNVRQQGIPQQTTNHNTNHTEVELYRDTEGCNQPLTDVGDKMGPKPEPSEGFNFPRLKETKGVITPHMQAKPEVTDMSSGSPTTAAGTVSRNRPVFCKGQQSGRQTIYNTNASLFLTRMAPPGLPECATSTPTGVTVASQADIIAPLPVNSHTARGGANIQEPSNNDAPSTTGPAFLAKSEVKDSSGSSPTTKDTAVQGGLAVVAHGNAAESMAEAEGVQDIAQSAAAADAPAAAKAFTGKPGTPTSPPRRVVYVTPPPPGTLATMSADERQSYQESLHRVILHQGDSTSSAALTGAYVTPMPPQLSTNISSSSSSIRRDTIAEQSHEIQEQRANRRHGSSGNAVGHGPESHSGSTWEGEQADASWQGNDTAQATAAQPYNKKTRGNNRIQRRKARQQSAGNEHCHLNAV